MIIVSRKPIMAGYQLLVFKMLYIYVLLICDTLINYYLLYFMIYGYNQVRFFKLVSTWQYEVRYFHVDANFRAYLMSMVITSSACGS